MQGKFIIYRAYRHWCFIIPKVASYLFLLAMLYFWTIVFVVALVTEYPLTSLFKLVIFGFIMIFIGCVVIVYLDYKNSEFIITNKRVIVKTGFLFRNSINILLSKIEGVGATQGIMGRMLDFGTIVVNGIGGTRELSYSIAAPQEFKKSIQEAVERYTF